MRVLLCAVLILASAEVRADSDGVLAPGRLSDEAFYRLATCGAPEGGRCQGKVVVWRKRVLSVALRPAQTEFPDVLLPDVDTAMDRAISELNAAGAGIKLFRDDSRRFADILVMPVAFREGQRIRDIPRMDDGLTIGAGQMTLWYDDAGKADECGIVIAADIMASALPSIMLEEMFQCLGFLYDVEGDAYHDRSILSQDSNAVTRISGQDAAILRLHYPPR